MQALKAVWRSAGVLQKLQPHGLASALYGGPAQDASQAACTKMTACARMMHLPAHGSHNQAAEAAADAASWQQYLERGMDINPCGALTVVGVCHSMAHEMHVPACL